MSAKNHDAGDCTWAGIVIYDIDAATSVLVMITKRGLFASPLLRKPLSVGGGK